jgi:methionyl-tRNA formyltransferase
MRYAILKSMPNNQQKLRCIFIGTPDFAVPSLMALCKDDRFEVAAVINQPDKIVGRKQELTPPAVKIAAIDCGLEVFQPARLSPFADSDEGKSLFNSGIDLIVVAAYAQILPKKVLASPRLGCLNVHASLLPAYRGAAPIQAAIMNGDHETGISIMLMDAGLDTGPILSQAKLAISPDDTSGSLFKKLAALGANELIKTAVDFSLGKIKYMPQDESRASYARALKKSDGLIDWSGSAEEIERKVRAMDPWPGAYAQVESKKLKVKKVNKVNLDGQVKYIVKKPGEIFMNDGKMCIQCGKDALEIERVQLEGKKEMSAEEFMRGHKEFIGKILK